MEKVKRLIEAGATIPGAIKEALGFPLTKLAEKHGLPRSSISNHVNGTVRAPIETVRALVAELGGTEEEWQHLLWQAGKPAVVTADPEVAA